MPLNLTALPTSAIIGIVGGGQLGRMMAMAAAQLGYRTHIYSPEKNCPAQAVAHASTIAAYDDEAALTAFISAVDAVTVEFENIPVVAAEFLAKHKPFYPLPALFATCQHRGSEKNFVRECGGEVAPFVLAHSEAELHDAVKEIGTPCLAKHTTEGYDGKGQYRIHEADECADVWEKANGKELIIEALIPFVSEASMIIARDKAGEIAHFPIADNVHENGILATSSVPTSLSGETQQAIKKLATIIAEKGELVGLLAIEFFVLKDGSVLVNEMAPRPHNSGHWTMDGCNVSQFEQIIRICAGLPMKKPEVLVPTLMHNLIGNDVEALDEYWGNPKAAVHLYGKQECRAGRKMGHVNILQSKSMSLKKK